MMRMATIIGVCLLFGLAAPGPAASAQDLRAEAARYMAQPNLVRAGFGEDPGVPSGTPLQLPAGVAVSAPVEGVESTSDCGAAYGAGGNVRVCLPLCNTTSASIPVRLPAGLTVASKSASRYQNGILLQEVVVEVPPTNCGPGGIPIDEDPVELESRGGPAKVASPFQVGLAMFCLNEARSPSETGVPYALAAVTNDPDMLDLLERVRGLTLDEEAAETLQTAIYSITEGRGLTPADRAAMAAF